MEVTTYWLSIDKLVSKKVLVAGTSSHPCAIGSDAQCVISIRDVSCHGNAHSWLQLSSDIKEYFSGDFEGAFQLGRSNTNEGRGFERCVQTMLPGEVSILTLLIKSTNELENTEENMNGTICCQVSKKEILSKNLIFQLDGNEKYNIAMNHKSGGVELCKNSRYVDAFLRFSHGLKYLISIEADYSSECTSSDSIKTLRAALYNNMALCQLKLNNFDHALTLCDKVLTLEPLNVKALYRRAVANVELRHYSEAKDDLKAVLKHEPSNTAAVNKLKEVNALVGNLEANYVNVVKKMFNQDMN